MRREEKLGKADSGEMTDTKKRKGAELSARSLNCLIRQPKCESTKKLAESLN